MTPLTILCGFLGAGKTTFLRKLLPEMTAAGLRPRVIINDYQNAAVDAALLREVAHVVEPVSGSCICCGSREELVGALAALGASTGPGDVVVVEANGTTDTELMLEILGAAPELGRLTQPLQLTVVDAQRFGTHDWRNELERVQIRTATHVFISRRDVVTPARAAEVESAVRTLAPHARQSAPADLAREMKEVSAQVRVVPERRELLHNHVAAHFASLEVPLPGLYDGEGFAAFLRGLPPEVLRAKGIVALREPPGAKRSFQKVDSQVEVSDCELFEPETLECTAVFIGVQLPVEAIRAGLAGLAKE